MADKQENPDWLAQADELCEILAWYVKELYGAPRTWNADFFSLTFCVFCFKTALLFRSLELASSASDLFHQNAQVSGAILTRSLFETTAMLNCLHQECATIIKKHSKGKLCDYINEFISKMTKIGFASTLQEKIEEKWDVKPFEASGLIKNLDSKIMADGSAKEAYDVLCQMVHTNYEGCLTPFVKWESVGLPMKFTQDYSHWKEKSSYCHMILFSLLEMVVTLESKIREILPKFDVVMEEYYNQKNGDFDSAEKS